MDGLTDAEAARVEATAAGVTLARDLVNRPYNALDAMALADVARGLAEEHGLEFEAWDREECARRGLGLFLSVAQGSEQEPRFITLRYRPEGARRSVALVGKGVMFDTGGYTLKTMQGMATMKGDMGGAAAVLGAMKAVALLAPDTEVRAYVAATDNAVSATAMRPGDVFRGVTGKTVEVTNTDAEGRLTLADALAVAEMDAPDVVVDLATLTGAKVTALGDDVAALF
ncbi:leucyl aminopeptidase family protein, partial [Deinococcus pimensis]|uniref:leucyl aminopeptidase family protein n=1 Tax=Deinococcus pimensis TaxID=309888 RepID=UPI002480752A